MSHFLSILAKIGADIQKAVTVESNIVPLFIHNPATQGIAAVVITLESEIATVLQAFGQSSTSQTQPPTQPTA